MKIFSYSIIGEDVAHSTFINEFLRHVASDEAQQAQFNLNGNCYRQFRFTAKSHVLNNYVDVANRSFYVFGINLLFVVIDYDDWDVSEFISVHQGLHNKLGKEIKKQTLILLPVQAIEYWLWYIESNQATSDSHRNKRIEGQKREWAKKEIYGNKQPDKERTKKRVAEVMDNLDIKWLCSRSDSFKHFYIAFQKAIT